MSAWRGGLAVVFLGPLLALSACRRSVHETGDPGDRVGTTTLTGAVVNVPGDIAREQVAQARCERHRRCEHIDDTYLSECIAQAQAELQGRLGRAACPGGVDERALRNCVDFTMYRASCDDEHDRAKREALCAPSMLCVKP